MSLPYAENTNYYRTSNSAPGVWLERAERLIEQMGGRVLMIGKGQDGEGRSAYCVEFSFEPDRFRAIWPVLPSKFTNPSDADRLAAERQAATLLHHDVKARILRHAIFGARSAFFEFLLLPDGRTAAHLANSELEGWTPRGLLKP